MKRESPTTSAQGEDSAVRSISRQVQHNCAISDAIYARDYTLCVYLLRMREFYRWQHGVPLGKHLSLDDVGDWVSQTEQYWDEIEEQSFIPIRVGEVEFDPFDCDEINASLMRNASDDGVSLVYSAGLGRRGQPHFLLAEGELKPVKGGVHLDRVQVCICANELARDINAPVAMTRGAIIVVSHAGLQRMLWELYEEWSFHRNDGPMCRLSHRYGWIDSFDNAASLATASDELLDVLIAHECGEHMATEYLPENWPAMMQSAISANGSVTNSGAGSNELYMRAVRDNLADSLQTWPLIVDRAEPAWMDFWLASLGPMRRKMLAATDFETVLSASDQQTRMSALATVVPGQSEHWKQLAQRMSAQHLQSERGGDFAALFAD